MFSCLCVAQIKNVQVKPVLACPVRPYMIGHDWAEKLVGQDMIRLRCL